ncbi:MAG: hypothetical protein AB1768_20025 [Pseudomonadota bacterium]
MIWRLVLTWMLAMGTAYATRPMPPKHTPEDKVRLSEFVVVGEVTGVICSRRDPENLERIVYFDDGPECGDENVYGVGTAMQVTLREVLCRRVDIAIPSTFITSPLDDSAPNALRKRAVGKTFILFLKRRKTAGGTVFDEPPYHFPMSKYAVLPEPVANRAQFEPAFRKLCLDRNDR